MTGRGGMGGSGSAGGGTLAATGNAGGAGLSAAATADLSNQPMDLAQKTMGRSLEPGGGLVKGSTKLVHYTAGGVAQILTTSGTTAHVVTAKTAGRTESMGVGGQTVTLVSRPSAPTSALNLASQGPVSSGGGSGTQTVRTVAHPGAPNTTTVVTSASAHLAYHIPRGAAAVANMAAPRSQTVATPIVRATGQPHGQQNSNVSGPRGVVGQRVVPVSSSSGSGWPRSSPSPAAHAGKLTAGSPIHPGVTATSLGVTRGSVPGQRPGQPAGSIATYHGGVRTSGVATSSIRGASHATTMRGMVTADQPRANTAKAVHITQPLVQPQKYGSLTGVVPGGNRGPSAGSNVVTPANALYSPGNTLVTTMAAGPGGVSTQGAIRAQAPPAIAVRITTAPVPTDTSTQVTSQAGASIAAMTSPSGGGSGTILTHHPIHRTHQEHHVPLKTPIVRTPLAAHHSNKSGNQGQSLAFDGPKVITQPAQGPPLALAQIPGLTAVTAQKTPVSTHTVQQQQHPPNVQHRAGSGVVGNSVGRIMSNAPIPVAKVIPQQVSGPGQVSVTAATAPRLPHGQVRAQSPAHTQSTADPQPAHTNVFLHRAHATGVTVTSGGGGSGQGEHRVVTTVPHYITPSYYYEQGQNTYQVGGPTLVPHTLNSNHYVPPNIQAGALRVTTGSTTTNQGGGGVLAVQGAVVEGAPNQGSVAVPPMKPNASPRPSILRKRPDNDGTPLKATKNLSAALNLPMPSPPSPKRPDSRGNGNASSGSTTISANSSPGLQIEELDSSSNTGLGLVSSGGISISGNAMLTPPSIKQEPPEDATLVLPQPQPLTTTTPDGCNNTITGSIATTTLTVPQPMLSVGGLHNTTQIMADGLSPRKKPRKQQLMGNELQEARSSEDDLEPPPLKKNKREIADENHDLDGSEDEGGGDWSEPGGGGSSGGSCVGGGGGGGNSGYTTVVITNRPTMSLLNSFRQTWKPRHNHFVRYADVKPKDERRMTVNEIANQKMALQRVNGWKVVHLTGQVDDLVELESEVVDRLHMLLTSLEKRTHPRKPYKVGKDFDKDVNRLSELVKANIQRSKIIKDQMTEARTQMHKLFDHKGKIVDIMNKYSSKRSLRKKEKS